MSYQSEYQARCRAKGLCIRCGKLADVPRVHCVSCLEDNRVRSRRQHQGYKKEAFDHYGRTCVCCGKVFDDVFLTLNHVGNDGAAHRKEVGSNMALWAKRNGFPSVLETNCWNCNGAKLVNNGICPCRKGEA